MHGSFAISRLSARRHVARLLLALSIALIGFAHQPPAAGAQPAQGVDLSAYALPDGSLPVLCLGVDGGGEATSGLHCPACLVSKGFVLAAPAGGLFAAFRPARAERRATNPLFLVRAVWPPSAPPTAPPTA